MIERTLKTLVTLLLFYVIAAPLTSVISMDVAQTEWLNLWTYVFWAFGPFIWAGVIMLAILGVGLAIAAVVSVICLVAAAWSVLADARGW